MRINSYLLPVVAVRSFALALMILTATLASAQTPIQVTEAVAPGDHFTLVGDDLRSTDTFLLAQVLNDGTLSDQVPCTVQSMSDSVALLDAPADLSPGLWQLTIARDSTQSDPIILNRARVVSVDTDVFKPGDLVRIYGHNLTGVGGAKPLVTFIDSDGNRLPAVVKMAEPHFASFYAPANATLGEDYRLVVSNGSGPSQAAEVDAPWTLQALATDSDPLKLDVPWSGQFASFANNIINAKTDRRVAHHMLGSAVQDDTNALQGIIDYAASIGGGVVYIPAGSYRIDGTIGTGRGVIELKPNVILMGDGKWKTILSFGMRYTTNKPDVTNYWMYMWEGGRNGLLNLSIRNENGNSVLNSTIRRGSGTVKEDYFFIKGVEIRLNHGGPLTLDHTRHGLIDNCLITTTTTSGPIFDLSDSSWIRFQNNEVKYRVNRLRFGEMVDSQITGNTFSRDMTFAVPSSSETGGLETSRAQRIAVQGNTIQGVGQVSTRGTVDGEMIMTQRSIITDLQRDGMVTSATADAIYDSKASWPAGDWRDASYREGPARMIVAIVGGQGTGQWRFIDFVNYKTIHFTQPWTVVPDSTSHYIVTSLMNYQQFVLDNTITNGTCAVSFYQGSIDSVVSGNEIVDSGPIVIRGFTQGPDKGKLFDDLSWYCVVDDNHMTNSNGSMAAAISLTATTFGTRTLECELLANSVCNNVIDVLWLPVSYSYAVAPKDGYISQHFASSAPLNPYANVGGVFSGNVCNGLFLPFFTKDIRLTIGF